MDRPSISSLGYHPEAELVFGVTCPLGVNYRPVLDSFKNYLEQFGYKYNEIKISNAFDDLAVQLGMEIPRKNRSKVEMIWHKIGVGNSIREKTQKSDIFALLAAARIESCREESADPAPLNKTAHVVISLKRPEEVEALRRIYGTGFFLIGIAPTERLRKMYFDELGVDEDVRNLLVETDANENLEYGQRTRDSFYLSDVFISVEDFNSQVSRFLDLVFGNPFHTPTADERGMYLAYSASLGSGDLARQVGAALHDEFGDCLAVGWNDVPKPLGGLYGPEDQAHRDMDRGVDANDAEKLAMAVQILQKVIPKLSKEDAMSSAREMLKGTGFFDITEFGRAVHAEMAALLACSRTGRTPRGSTLYVTTFPCHNCTRHIIAAGIAKVFYVEPYAKSKAFSLHGDAICGNESAESEDRVPFVPFIGIGPRRYWDLFSLKLSTGYPIERKEHGQKVAWTRAAASPRLQMSPVSYLVREKLAAAALDGIISEQSCNGGPNESNP